MEYPTSLCSVLSVLGDSGRIWNIILLCKHSLCLESLKDWETNLLCNVIYATLRISQEEIGMELANRGFIYNPYFRKPFKAQVNI